jgi:hypothetical protein
MHTFIYSFVHSLSHANAFIHVSTHAHACTHEFVRSFMYSAFTQSLTHSCMHTHSFIAFNHSLACPGVALATPDSAVHVTPASIDANSAVCGGEAYSAWPITYTT